jgi:hypothetical protein
MVADKSVRHYQKKQVNETAQSAPIIEADEEDHSKAA